MLWTHRRTTSMSNLSVQTCCPPAVARHSLLCCPRSSQRWKYTSFVPSDTSRCRRQQTAPKSSSESASSFPPEPNQEEQEELFYEGSGSNAELAISLALGTTLLYLPLTMASIGRRLWVSYKFTNRRMIVVTNSPMLKREVQIDYSKIKEIRTAPRAFGLWGDMVVFLKDGSRLELVGLERFDEIRDYIEGKIVD